MLVVTLKVNEKTVGELRVLNDGTGNRRWGNYKVTAWWKNTMKDGLNGSVDRYVRGFDRTRGAMALTHEILSDLGFGVRNLSAESRRLLLKTKRKGKNGKTAKSAQKA